MKNLLFICGPNGIGKTTISKEIIRQLPNSAYVDSDFSAYESAKKIIGRVK